MMPTKLPFDPSKHLIGSEQPNSRPGPVMDDEALARILQAQILAEQREISGGRDYQNHYQNDIQENYRSQSSGSGYGGDNRNYKGFQNGGANQQEIDDMQLTMILQRDEMDAMQNAQIRQQQTSQQQNTRHTSDLELARRMQQAEITDQVEGGYHGTLDYARRVQQQAFTNVNRQQRGSKEHSQLSRDSESHDSDLELAMKMQELEEMGMGSLNSCRNVMDNAQVPSRVRSHHTSDDRVRPRHNREDENAQLARVIAESSAEKPFRDPIIPAIAPRSQSPLTTPSPRTTQRHAIPIPPRPTPPHSRPSPSQSPPPRPTSRSPKPTMKSHAVPGSNMDPLAGNIGETNKKRGFFTRNQKPPKSTLAAVPPPIPPPSYGRHRPLPHSTLASEKLTVPIAPDAQVQKKKLISLVKKKEAVICSSCEMPVTSFVMALDRKYHADCFTCVGCHLTINSNGPFAYMTDDSGVKHPLHRNCYIELYGVKCAVCKQLIPTGSNGKVSFVKHPFFETEQMCPHHATNPGRRCTGCHRFEPEGEPFADLNDSGRCVCYSCCRTVVVDSNDATPLWNKVLDFMENKLSLPIWKAMREIPILIVGYDALNDQLMASGGAHGGSSQIMTRGLCLTEHESGRRLKLQSMKFNKNNFSFDCCDAEEKGFTYFQVPDASKVNPDASVTAIMCLSGLPSDLVTSVLAHEATHAWIKLHPRFDIGYPISPKVEEGCAQLIAMLLLNEGLDPASMETYGDPGPSDAKLRQYFKFSIETDDHEIYGEGYRRAAKAYADIGIEALLSHVVLYKAFPNT